MRVGVEARVSEGRGKDEGGGRMRARAQVGSEARERVGKRVGCPGVGCVWGAREGGAHGKGERRARMRARMKARVSVGQG